MNSYLTAPVRPWGAIRKARDFARKESMSTKIRKRIHLIYGGILSALILAVGVCFALSCISIYRSGDSAPYTPESIAAHFAPMAPLVYVTLAGVVGGVILAWALPRRDLVVPGPEDDPLDVIVERYRRGFYRPVKDPAALLKRMLTRLDEEAVSPACRASLRKERRLRRVVAIIAAVAVVAVMLPAFVWCMDPTHFSVEHLSVDIKAAALLVIPCALVALGLLVAATLLRRASVLRETATVKAAMAEGKGRTAPAKKINPESANPLSDPRILWGVRGLILAVGLLLVLLGISNGGMADVLGKAIRICTECIGLG